MGIGSVLWLGGTMFATEPAAAKPAELLLSELPTTVHPLYAWTREDELLASLVHAALFSPDGAGGWRSDLVEDLAFEGNVATLRLAKRKWHDKQPLVPADVCASIDRVRSADRPTRFTAAATARIAACEVGERKESDTVRITFASTVTEPRAALTFPLVPAHAPEWAGAGPQNRLIPVGIGPYRLERREQPEPWRLLAHGRHLPWKKIDLVVVDDPGAQLAQGRGVGVPFLDPPDLPAVRRDPALEIEVIPADIVWALMINTSRAPLDNREVRVALDLLLDREALGSAVLGRDPDLQNQPWTPVSGPFPPRSALSSAGVPVATRDEHAATMALEAAGLTQTEGRWTVGDRPWTLRVVTPAGIGPAPEQLDAALEAQLPGVDIEVVALSAVQWWLSLLGGGHAEVTDLALVPVRPEQLPALFHARTSTQGWANPFGWHDPQVDAWLDAPLDPERAQLLHGTLADQRPALFLWSVEGRAAWRGAERLDLR